MPVGPMHPLPVDIRQRLSPHLYAGFIERLRQVYADMDAAYAQAASGYGFSCAGCTDNCCRTHFFHHTCIEYAYLLEGLQSLPAADRVQIRTRAETVCARTAAADSVRIMCPLNFAGLCRLYAYRPMICRLHGIPHELTGPDRRSVQAPGCDTFAQRCGRPYRRFDRTPLYRRMAALESDFRRAAGLEGKFKATVARMLAHPAAVNRAPRRDA